MENSVNLLFSFISSFSSVLLKILVMLPNLESLKLSCYNRCQKPGTSITVACTQLPVKGP